MKNYVTGLTFLLLMDLRIAKRLDLLNVYVGIQYLQKIDKKKKWGQKRLAHELGMTEPTLNKKVTVLENMKMIKVDRTEKTFKYTFPVYEY